MQIYYIAWLVAIFYTYYTTINNENNEYELKAHSLIVNSSDEDQKARKLEWLRILGL